MQYGCLATSFRVCFIRYHFYGFKFFCVFQFLFSFFRIIVAVAKDLSKEFYQFFYPSILRESIRLLDTREPDQIEWIFTCLAYLFKYLWVPIVRNISSILPELLPLLSSSQPEYIINFAAESFAYVARKVRDKSQFLKLSLRNIKNSDDVSVNLSLILRSSKSLHLYKMTYKYD